ncbi:MAG: tetratricopeptide repeat protein [Lewinellaceae bacterium]|nr:tetratricopeptide repeat protein [Lewinellaceae bacterium]
MTENDLYLYDPSNEAERIVAEIVDALGLIKNFTVRSSNVSNALATTNNGVRFIFYSTSFLEKFKADANTQWAAYSVLAHEIGHHLNGHNFGETNPRTRKMLELEADQFSGSVLRMLGASIEEAQAGLNTFDLQGETNTHPPTARKEAVSNGWKKRDEWLRDRGMKVERKVSNSMVKTPTTPKQDNKALAKEWYDKGVAEETDMNKKIEYYTKAIQLDPTYSSAYNNRGNSKYNLDKYVEAIADYDKTIQLDPNYAIAYNNRGASKKELGKYAESILDYDKAIQSDPNYTNAYNNRGVSKKELGRHTEAITDFEKAIQLNPNHAKAHANKGCSLVKLGRYGEAVDNINKALKMDSSLTYARDCKAEALKELGKN